MEIYKTVVVPLGCTVVGGLFSLLVGMWILHRSEWFKSMQRWDPVFHELWKKRFELYGPLIHSALNLESAAEVLSESSKDLEAADLEAIDLKLNDSRKLFRAFMAEFMRSIPILSVDVQRHIQSLVRNVRDMIDRHQRRESGVPVPPSVIPDIVNAMRSDLHVRKLDAHAIQAISSLAASTN